VTATDAQFDPRVLAYECDGYRLGYDLQQMQASRDAHIYEATVLYAARILEALSAEALRTVGLEAKYNTFSNLERIYDYNLAPKGTLYWAHALRRIGNATRHAKTEVQPADEEASAMFLDSWLRWFFCRFAYGEQLERLTAGGERSPLVRDEALYEVIAKVDEDRYDPAEAMADKRLMAMSVTVAVLAEKLLSTKRVDDALAVLGEAVRAFPDDLRLLQLQGLARKRKGDAAGAMELLEPLYRRYSNDQEMAGIMAGAYKEMWRDSDDAQWLRKSHKAYANGWRQDRNSTYLGINTATTALLLGRTEDAQEAATSVRDVLVKRQTSLAARGDDALHDLTLWDRLTLVEANLLLRERDEVLALFAAAKRDHPDALGDLDVARRQLVMVAHQLDERDLADALMDVPLQ